MANPEIYTLSLHDLFRSPCCAKICLACSAAAKARSYSPNRISGCMEVQPLILRSEEHTSELQSLRHLVCRLLLEKKKKSTLVTPHDSEQLYTADDYSPDG